MRFAEPRDTDKSAEMVLHALKKGITYFDTAPGYCDDQSEIILGTAVPEMKKTGLPFTLSSKSMKKDGSEVRKQLETTLTRLNTDCLDFYNCWYVLTPEDWAARKARGAVAEILKAREEGLIRHAVFSTHLPGEEIRKVIEEGYFEGVTLGYSVLNFPHREEGIASARENGLGVVVMNPLGGGMITSSPELFDFVRIRPDQSILEGALHFLFSDPRITVSLVGFRNTADIDSAVAAVDSFVPYREEQIRLIRERLTGGMNSLCTSCRYCRDCPAEIPVWAFAEAANHLLLGSKDSPEGRLKNYWGVDPSLVDQCTRCGYCESVCTQKLPIMERFDLIRKGLNDQ